MAPAPASPSPAADRDVLISRLLDGRAGDADWASLRELAAADATLWAEIAETRRLDQSLVAAVQQASARAEFIDLPGPAAVLGSPARRIVVPPRLGWAVAAMLALALIGMIFGTRPAGTIQPLGPGNSAGISLPTFDSPSQALAAYLDMGKRAGNVVGEMPQMFVLDSRPLPGGEGVEVTYVRQIVEKAIVKDFYRVGTDENGRPVPVPAAGSPAPAGTGPASPGPM